MDMAMDTAMERKVIGSNVLLSVIGLVVSLNGVAAEVEFTPHVGGEFTYTDNIDLEAANKKSSEIATISSGIELSSKGKDGDLSLDYQLRQLLYSHDSHKNELYNDLSFSAYKGLLSETQLRANANASIDNIARDITENARDDIITGDTIETRSFGVGLSYQSNRRDLIDLSSELAAQATLNEDDTGDNNQYSANINFDNGQAVKRYFWETEYSYTTNIGRTSNSRTQTHLYKQKVGLQQINGFSPFLNYFYEDIIGQGATDSADSANWGPGVRYYWHKRSYVEVSYEHDLKDKNSDFWRGALFLNPTSRTTLSFDYTKRFYGDAYDFSLSHRNKRLTNSIDYTEEVSSFDREFLVPGNIIEELSVNKTLSWESKLKLRRSSFTLELRTREQKSVSEASQNTNSDSYGSTLSMEHNLTRKASLNSSFKYDHFEFGTQGQSSRHDRYRVWDIGLELEPVEELSFDITLAHQNRSSTNSSTEYKENRVNLSLRKDF